MRELDRRSPEKWARDCLPKFHRDRWVSLEGRRIGRWMRDDRRTFTFRHLDGTELRQYYPLSNLKTTIRQRWHSEWKDNA